MTRSASFSLIYDPNPKSGWAGYWSYYDYVWVDCSPASPVFTNDPGCGLANKTFFYRGYAVNSMFDAENVNGGSAGEQYAAPPVPEAAVPEASNTSLVLDTKNLEPFTFYTSMDEALVSQYQGPAGGQGQYAADAPRPYSWWTTHNHGIQCSFADGHAKFMRHQQYMASNYAKWDCLSTGSDLKTWPSGSFTSAACDGLASGAAYAASAEAAVPLEER